MCCDVSGLTSTCVVLGSGFLPSNQAINTRSSGLASGLRALLSGLWLPSHISSSYSVLSIRMLLLVLVGYSLAAPQVIVALLQCAVLRWLFQWAQEALCILQLCAYHIERGGAGFDMPETSDARCLTCLHRGRRCHQQLQWCLHSGGKRQFEYSCYTEQLQIMWCYCRAYFEDAASMQLI